jgi:hypothetical protein
MKHEIFLNIMDNFTGKKTTEELINEYHKGNKDVIIAFVYETGHGQFNSIASKFLGLDESTKESVILEQIWKALENYKLGSHAQLTSLICTYIYNELRHLTQSEKMQKRVLNQCTHTQLFSDYFSSDADGDEDKNSCMGHTDRKDFDEVELRYYIDSIDMNDNQRKFCNALLEGCKPTKSAVAAQIGISRAGANVIVKALQDKLIDLKAV